MVKQASRTEVARTNPRAVESRNGLFRSYMRIWGSALTIRPLSEQNVDNPLACLILFVLTLGILQGLALWCSMLGFDGSGLGLGETFAKFGVMYLIFLTAAFGFSLIFTAWIGKGFKSFTVLVFVSTCAWAPLIALLRFIPYVKEAMTLGAFFIMGYYCTESLGTEYRPADQRESVIQSAIGFIGVLVLYAILIV